ncbi:MAG: AmmeMemoRadiSam system protein B [Candidatus Omnitrophota bacterium]|nr:AmmeMemoRadiSam system protein B [Candidatus Omnitrophota bacterium]
MRGSHHSAGVKLVIRNPAAAGQFYAGSRESLIKETVKLTQPSPEKKEDAIGVISPHAGYVYSGSVAGLTLGSIIPKPVYVIMGPNHTGLGSPFSLSTSDSWATPLGSVTINKTLAEKIIKNCPQISKDEFAHTQEHSIEVQLPILQTLQENFTIVPIVISQGGIELYRKIGQGIAKSIKELKLEKDVVIIASSDMTHYESQKSAEKKDSRAIDAILKLDEEALVECIEKFDISMCGSAPAAIMIVAAKSLGARRALLIKYQTSGDISGDYSSVVGYAGIVIY